MTTTIGTTVPSTTPPTSTGLSSTSTGSIVIGLDSLPVYDGTTPIDEFLTVVEGTGALANWNDGQLIAITLLKLRNKAKQFIDSEPALKNTTRWNVLKESLINQFKRQYVKGSAMKNFVECRQRSNESCRQYLTKLKLLGNRTITFTQDQAHDDAIRKKLEEDVTTQFILGLQMPIKQRVLSGDPQSLDEALKIAEREESIENLIHPSQQRDCRIVTTTNPTNSNFYHGNKMSTIPQPPTKQSFKCYKCQEYGHTANYCKAKDTRVCFKCNKQGHISTQCPQRNNWSRNGPPEKCCFSCNKPGHLSRHCPAKGNQAGSFYRQTGLNSSAAEFQPRSSAANQANWE